MARFTGFVRLSDLEGGVLQLEADDGTVYELEGDVGEQWAGRRVVIQGSVDRNALSFTMTGPRLLVRSVSAS
ncbi:MAG: hypothetical protein KA712_13560 [Myxococcales bacterium]|nr:hypothetical protein [Myxococcales bacterium]